MTDVTLDPDSLIQRPPIHMERTAWGILLISFAVFCVFCAASTLGLTWFFFQSSLPLHALAQNGRGTLGISAVGSSDQSVRDRPRVISRGMTLRTDTTDVWSQGTLMARDPRADDQLVALVTLKSDTSVEFISATSPRFRWMAFGYQLELNHLLGEIDVYLSPDLSRDVEMTLVTTSGAWVRLGSAGRYTLRASEDHLRVINYDGEAVIVAQDGRTARSIPQGQQGVYTVSDSQIEIAPQMLNLIQNSTLSFSREDQVLVGIPDNWVCGNELDYSTSTADNIPRGKHELAVSADGRRAIHFVRGDGATTNGKTFCEQTIGRPETGFDISQFNYLEMRVTLFIESHSVSSCGVRATECPLMIRIRFQGEDGGYRNWIQGIYAYSYPNDGYPQACDECRQYHLRIRENVWYTYESRNLFDLYQLQGERPIAITEIEIYASGHEYNVYMGDVSIIAGSISAAEDAASNATSGN